MKSLWNAVSAVLRFVLRLMALALALAFVATLFIFFMFALLLRMLFGGKANLKVSAHFQNMRNFKSMSQAVIRRSKGYGGAGPSADEAVLPRRQGPVQDVQARDLPPERH